MFDSLRIGLALLIELSPWEVLAVLPVDHPLVTAKTVARLAATDALATIPSYRGKHGHPICLRRAVAESIVDRALPGPTLRDALRTVNAVDVVVDDHGTIANCNTPEALKAALSRI